MTGSVSSQPDSGIAPPAGCRFSGKLITALHRARSVAAFTGAGISAESGVPTFRGNEGLWKKFNPAELANLSAFLRNPDLVWSWYQYRRQILGSCAPNAGHRALAEFEGRYSSFTVITQNIDGLHRKAGSRRVLELHGNIGQNHCADCGEAETGEIPLSQSAAPKCRLCGGLVRPSVVWFGELLPADVWTESVAAAEQADVFLCVGTSGVVYPAASLPSIAKRSGGYLVEINVERTDLSPIADEVLLGRSGEILPALLQSLNPGAEPGP